MDFASKLRNAFVFRTIMPKKNHIFWIIAWIILVIILVILAIFFHCKVELVSIGLDCRNLINPTTPVDETGPLNDPEPNFTTKNIKDNMFFVDEIVVEIKRYGGNIGENKLSISTTIKNNYNYAYVLHINLKSIGSNDYYQYVEEVCSEPECRNKYVAIFESSFNMPQIDGIFSVAVSGFYIIKEAPIKFDTKYRDFRIKENNLT